ncbi:MAG: hypothetical protein SOW84_01810 [Candidatus Faecousia sp.]|nr:hypothetical protein [Candidatus Faecousia sp.]
MGPIVLYPIGSTKACRYASAFLGWEGLALTDHPTPEVTHLLLDVPSFTADGELRGGGDIRRVLEMLPSRVAVIGGNLNQPVLAAHQTVDLLRDPEYLAQNAAITAECALRIAGSLLPTVLTDSPALVIGWGRIGKCLGKLLASMGCSVTIAARKAADRAMAGALGLKAVDIPQIPAILPGIRMLFNTAPALILNAEVLDSCRGCVKIDLASTPGLSGSDVIFARGLPGQYAPESSGRQIARAVIRRIQEESV